MKPTLQVIDVLENKLELRSFAGNDLETCLLGDVSHALGGVALVLVGRDEVTHILKEAGEVGVIVLW